MARRIGIPRLSFSWKRPIGAVDGCARHSRPNEGSVMLDGAKKLRSLAKPSLVLSATCLLIHLIVNNQYGVFRDELYFIVCGQHPAWGYVDEPPLVPLIAGVSHTFFGTALFPLRLAAALAMTATVGLTAVFARILGGGRFAQWLSGLAVLVSPIYLADGLLLTTDFLQPLTWLGCSWCLVRLAQTRNERWWIAFGAIVGVSLVSKYLIVFYLMGLAVGVVATPLRRSLFRPWLYLVPRSRSSSLDPTSFGRPSMVGPSSRLARPLRAGRTPRCRHCRSSDSR
jgi:hypothetical protein